MAGVWPILRRIEGLWSRNGVEKLDAAFIARDVGRTLSGGF